ncbi:MAG: hypothetical protein ACQESJ_10700, partial [Bacteroidota bacterium]
MPSFFSTHRPLYAAVTKASGLHVSPHTAKKKTSINCYSANLFIFEKISRMMEFGDTLAKQSIKNQVLS